MSGRTTDLSLGGSARILHVIEVENADMSFKLSFMCLDQWDLLTQVLMGLPEFYMFSRRRNQTRVLNSFDVSRPVGPTDLSFGGTDRILHVIEVENADMSFKLSLMCLDQWDLLT